ncbi:Tyrosine 3-monooxygenase/tryptophan 5-monooxygenase activation protein theta polypeptide [Paragonimus heterotremus]|uniref:Tyrosine 3-monooxygenase/tryptophan 5-monooxygenase activation protein theta polypeptide n=1 Tax=Paragonimus heterotremus TaxID=100268 RepID=A0A8J4SIA6_9TREM|nr:Tyrosine 3-monooxygenase/tryptophan 5-monooxygenase activation protein theta polypeptide [Paragonimus heterotremus]
MGSRDELLFRAKLAEQTERYDEMVNYVEKIVKLGVELTPQERNLFSLAHKNFIGPRRTALRVINAAIEKGENEGSQYLEYDRIFQKQIESEMRQLSHSLIGLIETNLVKPDTTAESKAFYLKLRADYFRYLAEFEDGNDKNDAAEYSLAAYKEAYDLACSALQPTHPIRLGIALNFAVFYYEIIHSADRACKLAKQAFDDAIAELDNISDESYKDSTLIMQLLRDNLTLWISDMQKGETEPRE